MPVAAFNGLVSTVGVGFDIACGNCAIETDMSVQDLGTGDRRDRTLSKLADDIQSHISFGIGRSNLAKDAPVDHSLFNDPRWECLPRAADKDKLREIARNQLGTVGSGNHYVDVFYDEEGRIWVGVHFGSRRFGYDICTGFTCLAGGARWSSRVAASESNPGGLMHLNTWAGQAYWEMMQLAGTYAYVGREWVARTVVRLLGAQETHMVHNHHNFAWKESHYDSNTDQGKEYIVVRKGATPAFPGQEGFVGGSMGDQSVILRGTENWEGNSHTKESMLYSTVHGAGRTMGRAQAKGKKDKNTGEWKREPRVTQEMMDEWVQDARIYLRGGGVDESPHVYRRLPDVLEAQGDTIEVLHTLTPLIVVMAGSNEKNH